MPIDAGVVRLRLSLDSRNLIRETKIAASAAGSELRSLGAIYRNQTSNLQGSVTSSQQILRISEGIGRAERLKMLEQNKSLQLSKQSYGEAQRQLRIEQAIQAQVGKTVGQRQAARVEMERVAQIANQLDRQKIDLGFAAAVKDMREANSQMGLLTNGAKGFGLALKGALIGSGIGVAIAAFGALSQAISATVGAPFAAIAGYREYDQAISNLAVASDKTREELAPLTDTIKQLGVETSKSPVEVANLAVAFTRLGFSTEEAGEALEGIIRLNESGGGVLEQTGESIAGIIGTFGLAASDSTMIADLFVTAANGSATSVEALGGSFDRVGGSAATYGQTVQDVALALGVLANGGFREADRASTAYSQTLSALIAKSGEIKDTLGVDVFDVDTGDARQLTDIVGELSEKLEGLNDQDLSTVVASIIPDKEAQKGFLALLAGLDPANEKTKQLRTEFENAGGAAQAAGEKFLDSSNGQLELLGGSVEALKTSFAEGVDPAVKAVYSSLNLVVSELVNNSTLFDEISEKAQEFADKLANNPELVQKIADKLEQLITLGLNVAVDLADRLIKFLEDPDAVDSLLAGMTEFGESMKSVVLLAEILLATLVKAGEATASVGNFLSGGADNFKNLAGGGGGAGAAGSGALLGITGNTGRSSGPHLHVQYAPSYDSQRRRPTAEHLNRLQVDGRPLNSHGLTSEHRERNPGRPNHNGIDYGTRVGGRITSTVPIRSVSRPRLSGNGGGWVTTVTFTDGVQMELLHQDPSVQRAQLGGGGQGGPSAQTSSSSGSTSGPVTPYRGREASSTGGGSSSSSSPSQENLDRYFDAIAYLESGGNTRAVNRSTDARGAFQFTPITRTDAAQLGIANPGDPNASYEEQRRRAQQFAQKRDPRGYAAAASGDYAEASRQLNRRWTSLPGGAEMQNSERMAEFQRILGGGGSSASSSRSSSTSSSSSSSGVDMSQFTDNSDAERAAREAEQEAERIRQEALNAAKEARASAIAVRSATDEATDMIRDEEIKVSRSTQDLAIESAKAGSPNSERVQAVADQAQDRLDNFRKISDEIEQNNRAARDLNQAIADERSGANIEEPVNEDLIKQYERQLQQLGKSNQLLREQRIAEAAILDLKYKQATAEEIALRVRERAEEITGLQRKSLALQFDLSISLSDDPLETLKIELESAMADISQRYTDSFNELMVKFLELTAESTALNLILDLDPSAPAQIAEVNAELEHTRNLLIQLDQNRGLEETVAGVDIGKFLKQRREEFSTDLDDRDRGARLSNAENEGGLFNQRALERELGTLDIMRQRAKDIAEAFANFGSSPEFTAAAEQIERIAQADMSELINQTRTLGEELDNALGAELDSALKGLLDGTKTLGQAFLDVIGNMASALANLAVNSLFGGGGLGGLVSGLFGASGHIPGSGIRAQPAYDGHIPNYASGNPGGVIEAAIKEGDRMPSGASIVVANSSEAILTEGQQQSLAKSLSSTQTGGSVNSSVNVAYYGESKGENDMTSMSRELEKAVIGIVQKHSRPGGRLKGAR